MTEVINIIEPTLATEAGHCHSFINALCKASDGSRLLRIWLSRDAELSFSGNGVESCKFFFRRTRRIQSYLLYRKLLATSEKLFVSTAGLSDLVLLDWASKGVIPPNKVYLYFHWFNASASKLERLEKLARKQPNLAILGPMPSVVQAFQDAGFRNASVVPYPISPKAAAIRPETEGFRHLLYAGAARQEKGFAHVVNLVAHLREQGLQIPVSLQTSAEHFGKYDAGTLEDIRRLQAIAYPHLRVQPETLASEEYAALFDGSVCLQLYDPAGFADKVSGVTLDAFSAGSPVVALPGTWTARTVQRFGAGVIVEDASPQQVLAAVQHVIAEYPRYARLAREAGRVLQEENSAGILLRALSDMHREGASR